MENWGLLRHAANNVGILHVIPFHVGYFIFNISTIGELAEALSFMSRGMETWKYWNFILRLAQWLCVYTK